MLVLCEEEVDEVRRRKEWKEDRKDEEVFMTLITLAGWGGGGGRVKWSTWKSSSVSRGETLRTETAASVSSHRPCARGKGNKPHT